MSSFQMRAVLGCALAVASCGETKPPSEAAPPRFPLASPELKDITLEREYVAEIRATRHAELRSRVKGILETVAVDEGQPVKEGQPLFSVNARAFEQEVLVAKAATLAAEAELAAAQLEQQNTKLLLEKNVVSNAELALAASKVKTLQAKVGEAKAATARAAVEVSYAHVKAPFDGVVNRVPRKAGSALAEDELLTTLTDTREVFAYFRITEREYLDYAAAGAAGAHTATLRLANGTAFPRPGVVDAIASEFERETGTLAYRARFPNPEGILKHGSSGRVVLGHEVRGALLVPQKATFDVQGNLYVYVVDADRVAHARKLTIRGRYADAFVVEQGITREERFVLEGVQKVKDGARLEVLSPEALAKTSPQGG